MKINFSAALIGLLFTSRVFSQGYYYINRYVTLPDTTVITKTTDVSIPENTEDVRSVGMGKTQVANGSNFNAMMYNPALLSKEKLSIEAIGVAASLPPETFDAARFLSDHMDEFKKALSLRAIWDGVNKFKAPGSTSTQKLEALHQIQDGLKFPRDLLNQVVGSSSNPKTHGMKLIPGISVQAGNLGFSLYGTAQSGFEVHQSPIVDALLEINLPDNLDDETQVVNAITSMQGLLESVVDNYGNIDFGVLPVVYAFSYIDVVGAAGYGMHVTKDLSIGTNLKVVHRRFSTRRAVVDNYKTILTEVTKGLDSYITSFSMDLGALYHFSTGTDVGISLQNIIPMQTISSSVDVTVSASYLDYERDQFGRKVINAQDDTALVSYSRNINVGVPFELSFPFIASIGAYHPITSNWSVALDIDDIFEQDTRYTDYFQRLRFGSEYRFEAVRNIFSVIPRGGFSDNRFTFGLGLQIFRAIRLDGAYAYDRYVDKNAYYAQIKIGW
ncbi:MAG: hypothetical protein ACM34K_19290 [Bacillota bacterium]